MQAILFSTCREGENIFSMTNRGIGEDDQQDQCKECADGLLRRLLPLDRFSGWYVV